MSRLAVVASALALAAMLALQGCGSGGSKGTTTVTTTQPPAETTTAEVEKTTTTTTTQEEKTTTTTSTAHTYPGGLPECEDISTFYHASYNKGQKEATGMCLPSASPGAYYTKAGEKAPDNRSDRLWMCFNPEYEKSLWTNEEARAKGFEGACLFGDYNSTTTPDQVEDCSEHLSHHPSVCSPGPSANWGACWSKSSENWKCIPNGDATIAGLAKGDCKAQVLLDESGHPTTSFYDGACRFKKDKQVIYKCDTVPTASDCGDGADKACFTLKKGVNWQCISKVSPFTTPCDWVPLPTDDDEFYRGACVFKGNDEYPYAEDFPKFDNVINPRIVV